MEKAHAILKDTFGFSEFRLHQEAVIRRLLVDNDNALVLFPTGGGKSLTFQVPALCLDGLTLVISPLIALMKDQVDALCKRGVKAANLDSTLSMDRVATIKGEVLNGNLKILYVAPERLNNEGFVEMMRRVKISLLAVDESHCISIWGASFRPEYLKIARFAEELGVERVLCLTATATESVVKDICESFVIDPETGVFRTPMYRPNLAFQVEVANTFDQKMAKLVPFLKARTGPAIIYVTLQKHTEEVANRLRPHGFFPMIYHAGMPADQREKIQMDFMASDKGIVCATIAFGMGIDKANIRQVVHLFIPKTLEGYSQEVGRAGRDGLPSTCLMFLSGDDIPTLEGFARGDTCSRNDLQLWLKEVTGKAPAMDGSLSFNHYQQSKLYDIRANVLGLFYAQLELDYGHIRAVTPFYAQYDITPGRPDGWKKVMADNSPAAKAIKTYWGANYKVDVEDVAARTKIDRADLAKKINGWELDGNITTKASQVRARYVMLENPLPKSAEDIAALADKMYERMVKREDESIEKLYQVIELATTGSCLALHLTKYFGDVDVIPGGKCGICTHCTTGQAVSFKVPQSQDPDPARIKAILAACPERDDPRLLARMAFGIASPRLTANKWSSAHPLFGSMVDVNFSALVKAFDVECAKAGYQRDDAVAAAVSASSANTKKRSYSSANTEGSSYGSRSNSYASSARGGYGGRGGSGGSKRARRGR